MSSDDGVWKDVTHGHYKVFSIEALRRIADPAADQRIRVDLQMGDMREGGAAELRGRMRGDRCDRPASDGSGGGGLILRGFCLVSGYEFLRLPLDVCDPKTRFHLR